MADAPLDDVGAGERRRRRKDAVLMAPAPGFAAPTAVVTVVQAMPADAVRREGAPVVNEDEVDAIAHDEVMSLPGGHTADIAVEASRSGHACPDQSEAAEHDES